jgi:hypothetical protein
MQALVADIEHTRFVMIRSITVSIFG